MLSHYPFNECAEELLEEESHQILFMLRLMKNEQSKILVYTILS